MRDKERIGQILEQLRFVWQACPDLRLGQLLVIIGGKSFEGNPFFHEDDSWLEQLERFAGLHNLAPDDTIPYIDQGTSWVTDMGGYTVMATTQVK